MPFRVFYAAAVAAFVLLLPLGAWSADADRGTAIIAKHKAYVGWALGDGILKSARQSYRAVPPSPAPSPDPRATPDPLGEPNASTVELRRELLYRTSTTAYGVEVRSQGFTGSVFWRANVNGHTVPMRGRSAREELTTDVIDAEGLAEVPAMARPEETFDGKKADVVRIEPKTGVPADIYFDRDTSAMLGYRLEPDVPAERSTVHVVSYGEFAPGKRYPSAFRYGTSKWTYEVTKFDPNVAVSDADLHPPAPRTTWSFGPPQQSARAEMVRYIGMFMSGSRSINVDVAVNGHVGHFLFDSGAGSTLVYEPFAEKAGLKDLGRSGYSGVNGRIVRATLARADTMELAGSTLHDVIVQRSSTRFDKVDGIIGFDILANAVVEVDLVKHTLNVLDPNGFEKVIKPGAYAFSVDLSGFHAGVPMKVDGRVLPSVWLDTGDDYFLILPNEYSKRAVPLPNFPDFPFVGVDGESGENAYCRRLPDTQVGPYKYQDAITCFVPNHIFGLEGGLIGFDFLRHFNWTFDYPHGKVVLTPNGE